MQKVILLNFEQNDQEGGKWARPRYAGPHWNEQDCSHSTKMFMKYDKFEDTRRVLCTRVREIQRFQSLPQSVTQLAAKCHPAFRKMSLRFPQSVTEWEARPKCFTPLKVGSPFRGREIASAWRTHEQTNEEKCSVRNFGIWILLHLAESAVAAVESMSAKLRVLWLQLEAFLKSWECCGYSGKHFCKAESAAAAVGSISAKLRMLWLQ